jgi:hypothetical protein
MATQVQEAKCMLWFHKTKLVVAVQGEFGLTYLPDHPFVLGTYSLHRVAVSAEAESSGCLPVLEGIVGSKKLSE